MKVAQDIWFKLNYGKINVSESGLIRETIYADEMAQISSPLGIKQIDNEYRKELHKLLDTVIDNINCTIKHKSIKGEGR
jgi:hypothetical protein